MNTMAQIEIILFLREVKLFQYCSASEILGIAGIAHERVFPADQTIYLPGDPTEFLFCVVEGHIQLEQPDEHGNSESKVLGPHEAFGHREILSGRLRRGTAIAQTETRVLTIDSEDFFDLMANNIEIVKALFRKMLSPT
ncbi:Cyclic nucleotide-binding domain-containing protein [Sulfidibacter corallicola]|uniref:Cyclic nucleotide-binding domain-containing protein n=1 Tax=Sulfidibacter corallicola TaxID=2818388 RepID=A0A8A4TMU0_SULCO|nr:cyclic nucleotide-binding domain-containing protein [Sulfidibacter corallicola]QTD51286.1 cyclic nucleotide-binding domain-containing protein [Sulfidibacter corallicola]